MSASELMLTIEGHRFSATANVASNFKTFLRIVASQPEVVELARAMAQDRTVTTQLLQRAMELATTQPEGELEHDADVALATYLWLLNRYAQEFAERVAATVEGGAHFFWARKVAESQLPPRRLNAKPTETRQVPSADEPHPGRAGRPSPPEAAVPD